eukprot:m.107502 g.107502  ORF g.107502 m.107502 type:complete len:50 (+) comp27800_c7_seq1:76-225(+)
MFTKTNKERGAQERGGASFMNVCGGQRKRGWIISVCPTQMMIGDIFNKI